MNLINNKIYIGYHATNNINDKYMGSGNIILDAIKKYGKENFKKEILFIFDTEQEMRDKEKEIVNEEYLNILRDEKLTETRNFQERLEIVCNKYLKP